MKIIIRLVIAFLACATLILNAVAGPEPIRDYKESKEVKEVVPPAPPACDWSGIYIGLHAGGQFGHSENTDLDDWNLPDRHWGYSESGFVGGGQVGYNFQWHCLVLGPEFDVGYMDIDGSGVEPHAPNDDTVGHSDSDLYVTLRGRLGFAHDCWLFYATGGAIGLNYDARVLDNGTLPPGVNTIDAHETNFDWGYTVGGGIERMLGRHWSIKVEYLYYNIDAETFDGLQHFGAATNNFLNTPNGKTGSTFGFDGDTTGHIVRAGLNFKF